jgi:hypothetical protein
MDQIFLPGSLLGGNLAGSNGAVEFGNDLRQLAGGGITLCGSRMAVSIGHALVPQQFCRLAIDFGCQRPSSIGKK